MPLAPETGRPPAVDALFGLPGGAAMPDRAKRFETRTSADACDYLSDYTENRTRLQLTERFRSFAHYQSRLDRTKLEYFRFESNVPHDIVTTHYLDSELLLYVPCRGTMHFAQGGRWTAVEPGQIALIAADGRERNKRLSETCEALLFMIDRDTIGQTLKTAYGIEPDRAVRFAPLLVGDLADAPALWNFIRMVLWDINAPSSCFAEKATAGAAERTLMLMLAQNFMDDIDAYRRRSDASILPSYLRAAERYVRRSLSEPIAVEDLAEAAGVSVRTLYYGFQGFLGTTPMKFLKRMRLHAARDDLAAAARTGRTVTQIALDCGYQSLSSFSRDYRAQFGESASETMRGRAPAGPPRRS